jgi:hypothetical protein
MPSPLDPNSPTSLGAKIDDYWRLKDTISAANAVVTDLKKEKATMESELIALLDNQGTTGGQGHIARATINEQEVSQVQDFDALADFITEDPAERLYVLNRAVNNTHWKELRTMLQLEEIPGIGSFVKRNISINKVTK